MTLQTTPAKTKSPLCPDFRIGFIGAGKMALALASGFVESGQVRGEQILASDPSPSSRIQFQSALPASTLADDNRSVALNSDLLFLAVKPQAAKEALANINLADRDTIVVSVMAGVRFTTLQSWLKTSRIIRVMPNTPCLVAAGAIGFAAGDAVSREAQELAINLLTSVAIVVPTTESQLNAVTGLSGSGPAFVFSFVKGLIAGGIAGGLDPEQARDLAVQTVWGAATLLQKTGREPQQLMDQVISPGGTTLRGLEVLASAGFEQTVADCVMAATARAVELGLVES